MIINFIGDGDHDGDDGDIVDGEDNGWLEKTSWWTELL